MAYPETEEKTFVEATPWSALLDYEHADVICAVLKIFSSSFFQRDTLLLVQREEVTIQPGTDPILLNSLLIYGHVGYERRQAFLRLVRHVRLRMVQDVATSVSVGYVAGDAMPHVMLEPLVSCSHTESYLRWYRVFWAVRAGVLHLMNERRRMTEDRIRQMVRRITRQGNDDDRSPRKKDSDQTLSGDFYKTCFHLLAEERTDEEGRQFVPLELYHEATHERSIDLARIAASVPTIFVAWSYRNDESMQWLKTKLFNDVFLKELRSRTGLSGRFVSVMDVDPWLATVQEYVAVPKRKERGPGLEPQLLPPKCKRAQVVLVNVDKDANTARSVFARLLEGCCGWLSTEVSLLSLWAGPEGLQGEFAIMFNVNVLPFVIATTPARRSTQTYTLRRPLIISTSLHVYHEGVHPIGKQQRLISNRSLTQSHASPVEKAWHNLTCAERSGHIDCVGTFIRITGAPLTFCGRIDVVYEIDNPYAKYSTKALVSERYSDVSLTGRIADRDLLMMKDGLRALGEVSNFSFRGQVVKASEPMLITLDPVTPLRRIKGCTRTVTCTVCKEVVSIEASAHYRCVHCNPKKGLLCEACFGAGGKHPRHHILMRIPPNPSELTLQLLWGPSNVTLLPLFGDQLICNNWNSDSNVYCNRCCEVISGVRWKCAVCYTFDLCSMCHLKLLKGERGEGAAVGGQSYLKGGLPLPFDRSEHTLSHPLLCIQNGQNGGNNNFLRPVIVDRPFTTLLQK